MASMGSSSSVSEIRCRDCDYFDDEANECSIIPGQPRSCVIAINRNFIQSLAADSTVLEIGCGSWSFLKDRLSDSQWYGIDVRETEITTKVGSVGDIPYSSNSFDYVVSNQSMEHWFEFGTPLQRGLSEISRVLRKDGEAWLNVPIHLHGHGLFVRGDLESVQNLVRDEYWKILQLEKWRQDFRPEDPCRSWQRNTWIPDEVIPNDDDSVWILNIVLSKKARQPTDVQTAVSYRLGTAFSDAVRSIDFVPNYHPHVLNVFRLYDSKLHALRFIGSLLAKKLRPS